MQSQMEYMKTMVENQIALLRKEVKTELDQFKRDTKQELGKQ